MHKILSSVVVSFLAIQVGCAKKKSESQEEDTAATPPAGSQTGTVGVNTISDAKISDAMAVTVPTSVDAKGEGVPVTQAGTINAQLTQSGKKSREACLMRSKIRYSLAQLKEVAGVLCEIEETSKNLAVGGKYHWEPDADDQTKYAFWSRKVGTNVEVTVCEADSPIYHFVVNNSSGGRSSGTMRIYDNDPEENFLYSLVGSFDNKISSPDRVKLTFDSYIEDVDSGTSESYSEKERLYLNLHETELSYVRLAAERRYADETEAYSEQELSAARIGPQLGSVIVRLASKTDNDPTDFYGYRGYFDNGGNILQQADSPAFLATSQTYVTEKELPKPLDASFLVSPIGSDVWDCSGSSAISLDFDPDLSRCDALLAEADKANEFADAEDCYDDSIYSYSDEVEIDESNLDESLDDDDYNYELR